jgi:hypothetical protein
MELHAAGALVGGRAGLSAQQFRKKETVAIQFGHSPPRVLRGIT